MIVNVAVIQQETVNVQVDAVTRTSASDIQVYDGPYEAIPKVESQTLHTDKKLMTDDVTVHGVPFYEVSNDQGGNTVYIAKEYI